MPTNKQPVDLGAQVARAEADAASTLGRIDRANRVTVHGASAVSSADGFQ